MSDVYIPGISSRFNTEQLVENLMHLERIPRDRAQTNIEVLQSQKNYWQGVGTLIKQLQTSATNLYSFQNPFNDRIANSSDSSVITATTSRDIDEHSYSFTVKQTAQADRFLSQPLSENTRVDGGNYVFIVGNEEISINFRGGTLREFADVINRSGRDKIAASLIAVQSGTRSLLIESKLTGAENRLGFSGEAVNLVTSIGMMEVSNDTYRSIAISDNTIQKSGQNQSSTIINGGILQVAPLSNASIPLGITVNNDSPLTLRLETQTRVSQETAAPADIPSGPIIPPASISYGGITIENNPSSAPLPEYAPPAVPVRQDDMGVLNFRFSDGSSIRLPPITDSNNPAQRQYALGEYARGKTIVSLNIENNNTHREVYVGKIEVLDPTSTTGGLRPSNPVAVARDAIITMEGIEISRSTNNIDDLIPGITLNVRGVSEKPVSLNITTDREAIKDAIIMFVGHYNRLMTEINVLTSTRGNTSPDLPSSTVRGDTRLIDELTYITKDEADAMRERLGAFGADSTLMSLKNSLQRIVTGPYPTNLERDLTLLAQIGISSNAGGATGYDVSRLRGYLEINPRTLDAALENKIPAIKQLFANDTTGDLIADTGVAYNINSLVNPFVQTGGIISLKTNTIDSRISQDQSRIATLDRQLAAREQELRLQFARMESAYSRMESMSSSLDNFNQQNSNNR